MQKDKLKKEMTNSLIRLFIKIIIVFAMFVIIFGIVFGLTRVKTDTMKPSIREGDLLFYYRLNNKYKSGDVVVTKINNKKYVLRVVGVPNDKIDISEEGRLLVNGTLEENTIYYLTIKDKIKYPYKVKDNEYFLVNDYRTSIEDSRKFGSISIKNIKGKVIGRLQVRNM